MAHLGLHHTCGCHLKSQQLLEQPLEDHPQKGHQQRHHLSWHVSGDGKEMCCCGEDLHELVFFRVSDYMIFYALWLVFSTNRMVYILFKFSSNNCQISSIKLTSICIEGAWHPCHFFSIDYMLNNCLHHLDIRNFGLLLYQPTTYLINPKFHWSILGSARRTANHTIPLSPHCLKHFHRLVRGQVVMY